MIKMGDAVLEFHFRRLSSREYVVFKETAFIIGLCSGGGWVAKDWLKADG